MGYTAPPGNLGRRLPPSLVDELAESEPDRTIYSVAKTQDPADGFDDITMRAFAQAVNRCARFIEKNLGRGQGHSNLAYIGPQDMVYAIVILACAKAGYRAFLTSPRNSVEAHLTLLEKLDCKTFLLPPNFMLPTIKKVLSTRQMTVVDVPDRHYWLADNESEEPYPFDKTFDEVKTEKFFTVHTSGSTGLPKPVSHTYKSAATMDSYHVLPDYGMDPLFGGLGTGMRLYSAFPFFHIAGVFINLLGPIYYGYTSVIGPSPPSAGIANSVHIHGNVQASSFPPTVLIDLAKEPRYLEELGRLKQVMFGGGPLPKQIGDRIKTKTAVRSVIGSTECGTMPFETADKEDWEYVRLSPLMRHEFRHVSGDLYEMFLLRNEEELDAYQGVFSIFPEKQEFSLGDLFEKHPTKSDLWLYRGRADDIIVYSTGEKVNPVDMEGIISAHPGVAGALVAGQGRFQSSLLIEVADPPTDKAGREIFLDEIWPQINAANAKAPSHARIHKDMVILTSPDKPMPRVAKGTVQRRATNDLYSSELDELYARSGASKPVMKTAKKPKNGVKDDSGMEIVCQAIDNCTEISRDDITPDTDLFDVGLDSLQITTMAKYISECLSKEGVDASVEAQTIYSHHTLSALASVIDALRKGDHSCLTNGVSGEQAMRLLFDTYTADMPLTERPPLSKPSDRLVVLLTGSTGSMGSYILDALMKDSRVSRIYCLSRGPDISKRQKDAMSSKGLQAPSDKVVFLEANLSQPYFGLPHDTYRGLLRDVTTAIHNAWKVDFNQPVSAFSSNIQSVRRFVDFSAQSTYGAKIYFISSISTVSSKMGVMPEAIPKDWKSPQSAGYGQSKFVSEQILDMAARDAGVPAVVCRVGQVAGPTTKAGVWPKKEWLPSLVASSKHLGKLPTTLGAMDLVDWVPVDILGRAIVELATSSDGEDVSGGAGAAVHQTVNPRTVPWKDLAPAVQESLSSTDRKVELVSLDDWVTALRESAAVADLSKNPAVKLVEFFHGLRMAPGQTILDMERTCKVSKSLDHLEPVTSSWMKNWVAQWDL